MISLKARQLIARCKQTCLKCDLLGSYEFVISHAWNLVLYLVTSISINSPLHSPCRFIDMRRCFEIMSEGRRVLVHLRNSRRQNFKRTLCVLSERNSSIRAL
jgi:hypothetical protein